MSSGIGGSGGSVVRSRSTIRRGWRIVERSPGVWRGELHQRGTGVLSRTEDGPFKLVRATVDEHRQGLPLYVVPYRADREPGAA